MPNIGPLYDSQTQKNSRVSPNNAQITESTSKEVGGGFTSALDSVLWTASNSGTGSSAAVANATATLVSGTTNNGYGAIQTAVVARFHYAGANQCRSTQRMPVLGVAGAKAAWGAFNYGTKPAIQDGFFFAYDGSTNTLSVNVAKAGVVTSVASGAFNGEVTGYALDTNVHVYEIIYQVASALFFVDGVLLHTFKPGAAMLSGNMHLAANSIAYNSASGVLSASLEVWAQNILKIGGVPPQPQFIHIATATTTVIRLGPGTLRKIVVNAASANFTATVYDNTAGSGTVIAAISGSSAVGTLTYETDFQNGLTIVTTGATPADITVIYD